MKSKKREKEERKSKNENTRLRRFSMRKLTVRKIQIFTELQPFNLNLQQDLKIAAFWENPENIWSKFSKNSAKFWQIYNKSAKISAIPCNS